MVKGKLSPMRFLNQNKLKLMSICLLLLIIPNFIFCELKYDDTLDWKKLFKREIFVKGVRNSETKIPGVKTFFIVKAPLDFIWNTMIDSEKEKDIYTSDYKLKIINNTEKYEDVDYEVIIFFNKFNYRLHRIFDKDKNIISWEKIQGDFNSMSGYWEIQKTPEEGTYLIIYESYVDTGFFIPEFLIQLIQQDETRKMVQKLRDWLEKNKPKL